MKADYTQEDLKRAVYEIAEMTALIEQDIEEPIDVLCYEKRNGVTYKLYTKKQFEDDSDRRCLFKLDHGYEETPYTNLIGRHKLLGSYCAVRLVDFMPPVPIEPLEKQISHATAVGLIFAVSVLVFIVLQGGIGIWMGMGFWPTGFWP